VRAAPGTKIKIKIDRDMPETIMDKLR